MTIDYYGRRSLIAEAAQRHAQRKARAASGEFVIPIEKAPEPKPKPTPRPTGTKWKPNGSLGITILGCTKAEALRIIEQAFAAQPPDVDAERRVKCAVQIFEKVPE